MPRKSKSQPTTVNSKPTTTTIHSIPAPVNIPIPEELPVAEYSLDELAAEQKTSQAPADESIDEWEEEHRHYMNSEYCRDWGVREGESIPPDWKGPPIGRKVIQNEPAGTNMPTIVGIAQPVPAAAAPVMLETELPKITRHKGQRVQTSKAIYTSVPIQYRAAVDRLRDKTRKSMKEVLCEAIGLCAVKHGIASSPGAIMGWADWD